MAPTGGRGRGRGELVGVDLRSGDEVLGYARLLAERGYRRTGSWGLGQTCWHLAESMRLSVQGEDRPPRSFWRALIGRVAFRVIMLTRRMPRGARAPTRRVLPGDAVDEAEALQMLEEGVRLAEGASAFVVHPIFGRLTAEQWRELHWIHASHHLRLLEPAVASPGVDGLPDLEHVGH